MNVGAAGTATGGLIFPIIAQQLMPRVGFAWTVRAMGAVVIVNAGVILVVSRARLVGRRTGPLFEWSAFRERPYTLFCAAMFLNWWAPYFAFFYVSTDCFGFGADSGTTFCDDSLTRGFWGHRSACLQRRDSGLTRLCLSRFSCS